LRLLFADDEFDLNRRLAAISKNSGATSRGG
jgi:hypothetical protein